jgi:hypothetical protein
VLTVIFWWLEVINETPMIARTVLRTTLDLAIHRRELLEE